MLLEGEWFFNRVALHARHTKKTIFADNVAKNIQQVKMIQRRAARWVLGHYDTLDSVTDMLSSLTWRSPRKSTYLWIHPNFSLHRFFYLKILIIFFLKVTLVFEFIPVNCSQSWTLRASAGQWREPFASSHRVTNRVVLAWVLAPRVLSQYPCSLLKTVHLLLRP